MFTHSRPAWWFLPFLCLVAWVPTLGAGKDQFSADLRKAGIDPDRKGVEKFLESLRLTPDREAKVRALLVDLTSDRYPVRDKATAELLKMPPIPLRLLNEAAAKDQETRNRVQHILSKPPYTDYSAKVLLVLRFIESERVKGLAPLVLEMMPLWQDQYITYAAVKAVEASVERGDGKALRQILADSSSPPARAAAVAALASVFGAEVEKELEKFLADKMPAVRMAAAVALLNQDNRKPLPVLVDLLEDEQPEMRQSAAAVLKAVSSQEIAFASYDEPKKRAEAIAAWRDWVVKNGADAKLRLPVSQRASTRGRILIGIWGEKTLREVDAATGKTLFEAGGFQYVWGCHATPEGHRLAVDADARLVVEYDTEGKECWRCKVPGQPTSVERLPNGRTLIALWDPGWVIEIDGKGNVVWKVTLSGTPSTAQRLANGNTLVNLQMGKRVVEIDSKGKEVWELIVPGNPFTAQGLENGNVLVCDMSKQMMPGAAREYDRSGKVVWSSTAKIGNPAQAQRLPDGNTLISGTDGVMEFDQDNKLVRHIRVSRARFFAY